MSPAIEDYAKTIYSLQSRGSRATRVEVQA